MAEYSESKLFKSLGSVHFVFSELNLNFLIVQKSKDYHYYKNVFHILNVILLKFESKNL